MNAKESVSWAVWIVPILLVLTLFYNPSAEAGWRDDHHRHYGWGSGILYEGKNVTIALGGFRPYHHHDRFCRHHHREPIVIYEPAPVIITSIPHGCRKVIIDGRDYYKYNDVYYIPVAGGYRIVEPPASRYSRESRDDDDIVQPRGTSNTNSFTVNIPNSRGGYTTVILKRSGSGYSGPQGEYYPEFPRVEQLRAMYEK